MVNIKKKILLNNYSGPIIVLGRGNMVVYNADSGEAL